MTTAPVRPPTHWTLALAGTAVAYAVVGLASLLLSISPGFASPLFPSAGIALACVLVYGWRRISKLVPELPEVRDVASNAFNWVMGCVLVYGCLFGVGKLVFGEWGWGILLLLVASVAGYLIFWDLSRRGWATLSGTAVAARAHHAMNAD